MNLKEKLAKIQAEIKAPKDRYNDFGDFKYRSLEDVTAAVKPFMAKYNVLIRLNDDIAVVGDRFYLKATATIEDCESNESISATGWAREPEHKTKSDDAQVTGMSSSYARKYALSALLAIDSENDADSEDSTSSEAPQMTESLKAEMAERKRMLDDIALAKDDEYINKLIATKKVNSVDGLTTDYIRKVWEKFCKPAEEVQA